MYYGEVILVIIGSDDGLASHHQAIISTNTDVTSRHIMLMYSWPKYLSIPVNAQDLSAMLALGEMSYIARVVIAREIG